MLKPNLLNKMDEIADYFFDEIQGDEQKRPMLLHDPIHHTIRFDEHEREILDSPFLQRLKHIKQMGLAYVAYPDAQHSRFAHSAGVAHLSSKILQSSFNIDEKSVVSDTRLAGLLHDIGHGPLSHVTDRLVKDGFVLIDKIFSYGSEYEDLITEHKHKNFHELVAYLLIRTKRFREYLDTLQKKYNLSYNPDANFISSLVIGDFLGEYTDNPTKSIATKLINGDMDADKIDYILRDSAYTGLPIPIDYERLTFLFERLKTKTAEKSGFELGVSEKGARSFDLLLRSKNMLFPTVYQHHTTRGCEGMLIMAITIAFENPIEYKGKKMSTPLDFLYLNDCNLFEHLANHSNPIVQDAVNRLAKRLHYRRAFEIQWWFFHSRASRLEESEKADMLEQLGGIDEIFSESRINASLRLELKKELLKNVDLKEKLPKLSSASQEKVYDYAIFFDLTEAPPPRAYNEPYVRTKDPITKEYGRSSLVDMGFDMPKRKQTLMARVYSLPELREKVGSAFKKLIKKRYPKLYDASRISLVD